MKELIGYIARKLSRHPKLFYIEEKAKPDGSLEYTLYLHPEDLPPIIGRRGRSIRAIRALMAIKSAKSGKRAQLILDSLPEGRKGTSKSPPRKMA
ncbi:MAG: KH domain-containing protein [Deltaproteobacteria bacterium]|nr:KH domain-containing protein [Deltaproteobacteria bacterium]